MGAAGQLRSSRDDWQGTLVVVFQPAEETASGASAMIKDGLFERIPKPDVILGQHVAPLPAGVLGLRSGVAFAAVGSYHPRVRNHVLEAHRRGRTDHGCGALRPTDRSVPCDP